MQTTCAIPDELLQAYKNFKLSKESENSAFISTFCWLVVVVAFVSIYIFISSNLFKFPCYKCEYKCKGFQETKVYTIWVPLPNTNLYQGGGCSRTFERH